MLIRWQVLFSSLQTSPNVLLTPSEDLSVRREQSINLMQLIPLVLAAMLVTVGLAMVLSDARNILDVIQSVIVVFGGATAGLLLSFPLGQIVSALQMALDRGIHGGGSPRKMIRAMLKVCDVSRREGLLGVADIRSDSAEVEDVCHLIGEAADDTAIRFALERALARERVCHQTTLDVFLFAAVYALMFGLLGGMLRYVNSTPETLIGSVFLPFVCGASFAIMMTILIARLRAAHLREIVTAEIAYQGAAIILEDNNVQRLQARLSLLVPTGLRA